MIVAAYRGLPRRRGYVVDRVLAGLVIAIVAYCVGACMGAWFAYGANRREALAALELADAAVDLAAVDRARLESCLDITEACGRTVEMGEFCALWVP